VALAREDLEARVRNELHRVAQQVEAGERIAIAAHEEHGTADLAEVSGTELVGVARSMQRIREKDQPAEVRLDGGNARNAPAERLPASNNFVTAASSLDEDWDRALGLSLGQIDRNRMDAASLEADDVGLHRRSGARRAVTEDDSHQMVDARSIN